MNRETIGKCWSCNRELAASDFGRETLCLGCNKPTRVCKNCRWHNPGKTHQCAEVILEPVKDKERANYCEFFDATLESAAGNSASAENQRQVAEDLFK